MELVREVLALMPTGMVMANRERLPQVCGSAGAAQFVLCALTDADLITHGGMLSGSWLEPKGEWLLAALGAYPDLSWHLRECACPHRDCGPCDADCWVIPSTWPPLPADATSALF